MVPCNNQGTAFFTLFVTNEAKFVEATLTFEKKLKQYYEGNIMDLLVPFRIVFYNVPAMRALASKVYCQPYSPMSPHSTTSI